MNRRGHLSSKVPNVKLRPASAAPRRSTRRHHSPTHDMHLLSDGEDDESDGDLPMTTSARADKPWVDVVVTFTGVDDKLALSGLVREMGGEVESALTVKVTHVVASGPGSAKYLYAIEHRLPVMAPSWIADAHKRWIRGDTLDVPDSVDLHRLQPFLGLRIAVSGIDQMDRRKQVIKHITNAGGVYSKDLDRSCTHLVSAYPTRDPKGKASEKVKWALKEIGEREMLRRRGKRVDGDDIRIIYEEWIWDCVAFFGRWKEDNYDARKPRAKGKVTYESVMDGSAFLIPETDKPEGEQEEEEPAAIRKRKRDNINSLVGELLSTTGSKSPPAEEEVSIELDSGAPAEDVLPSRGDVFERKTSVLHASRSTAFAAGNAQSSRQLPSADADQPVAKRQRSHGSLAPGAFFSGCRISHAIAEGYDGLENALRQHGATIITEEERLAGAQVDYVVIRLSSNTRPPIEDDTQTMFVTECWVEACCFRQTLISPEENLVFRPLDIEHPLPQAETLNVHLSGFSTETRAFLHRLLRALGGILSEKFNRQVTHLVCAQPVGIKYEKAVEWNIPVVKESWIWTMGRSGRIEPTQDHAFEALPPPAYEESQARRTTPLATSTNVNGNANPSVVSDPVASADDSGSVPASRQLKPAPTHVDTKGRPASPALAAVMSPPSAVERRNLVRDPIASASHPGSSPRSAPRAADLKAAATVAVPGSAQSKDEVTAALRRLAEGGGASTSAKVVRRARSSNTSSRRDPSGSTTTATAPLSATASNSPTRAHAALEPVPIEDESIRVTYADAASDRERRRMLDAVLRGGSGGPSPGRSRS